MKEEFVTCRWQKNLFSHLEMKEEFVRHLQMTEKFVSHLQMKEESVSHLEMKKKIVSHLEMKNLLVTCRWRKDLLVTWRGRKNLLSHLQMREETEGKHLGFRSPPCIAECWIKPSPLCFQTFRRRQSPWHWPWSTPAWNSSCCWQRRCSSSTVSR